MTVIWTEQHKRHKSNSGMGVYKEVRVKIIPYFWNIKCREMEVRWIFQRGLLPVQRERGGKCLCAVMLLSLISRKITDSHVNLPPDVTEAHKCAGLILEFHAGKGFVIIAWGLHVAGIILILDKISTQQFIWHYGSLWLIKTDLFRSERAPHRAELCLKSSKWQRCFVICLFKQGCLDKTLLSELGQSQVKWTRIPPGGILLQWIRERFNNW